MCQKVFFNEVTGQQPRTLFKKESDAGSFCEFCKIFQSAFSEEHPWRLFSY